MTYEDFLRAVIEQAAKTINSGGHLVGCHFTGCNCGAVEEYKTNRSEFFRLLQQMKDAK